MCTTLADTGVSDGGRMSAGPEIQKSFYAKPQPWCPHPCSGIAVGVSKELQVSQRKCCVSKMQDATAACTCGENVKSHLFSENGSDEYSASSNVLGSSRPIRSSVRAEGCFWKAYVFKGYLYFSLPCCVGRRKFKAL